MTYFPLTNKKIGSLAVGICLAGAACFPANAVLVQYSFSSSTLTSGTTQAGSISGSFVYDTDESGNAAFSNINITTTAASSTTPSFNFASINYTGITAGDTSFAAFNDGSGQTLTMSFTNLSTAYLSNPSSFGASETQEGSSRAATSITATGTPVGVPLESDALSVMVAGTFLSGAYWLKRRRSAKSLAELSLSDGENN